VRLKASEPYVDLMLAGNWYLTGVATDQEVGISVKWITVFLPLIFSEKTTETFGREVSHARYQPAL
jgi:hypothetical protein